MKYITILGDGMADLPIEALGGKTPLEVAVKPNIDNLCKNGELMLVKTVPDNMAPGSDVANLAVMGYDPNRYYTGRSPLEALSIGIDFSQNDLTFRTNLVTLSDEEPYEKKTMVDYSADEISTEEARELILYINETFKTEEFRFYPGISYRHALVQIGGAGLMGKIKLTPPHDISGRVIGDYLPVGVEDIKNMMQRSYELLRNHPININRVARGKNPANSIWVWGEGTRPAFDLFYDKFGKRGSVISAVDLLKGIGKGTGMRVIEVEGATGNIGTNFLGKACAAVDELLVNDVDFVYLHIEAPDECGHRGELENKIKSIELIDELVVGHIVSGLREAGVEFSIMIMPDHPTPISTRTHAKDPVPCIIYRSGEKIKSNATYTEKNAALTGKLIYEGYNLINKFFEIGED